MKVNKRNLIEFIIQSGILILLFVPGMYRGTYYSVMDDGISKTLGGWKSGWTILVSHWSKSMSLSDTTVILLWALIIVICIALVLYLVQCIREKSNARLCILFLVSEVILFVVSAFVNHTSKGEPGNYTSYFSFSPYVVFPIMIILMITLILLSISDCFKYENMEERKKQM